jgi:hypothetical protein
MYRVVTVGFAIVRAVVDDTGVDSPVVGDHV